MVDPGSPIFVLAPHPRSGTNLLSHILSGHPCVQRCPVPEDYIAERAKLLADYAEHLVERWDKFFDRGRLHRENYPTDRLLAEFGQSLLNFVGPPDPDRHMLLKTPSLIDLPNLQRLFPGAPMLILLRDPRSIAESWVRSQFGRGSSLEEVGYRWANSLRGLESWLDPANAVLDRKNLHFVRFEDLSRDPATEYAKILDALDLSPDPTAIAYAADPPVIGSSFSPEQEAEPTSRNRVNFKPRPRPEGFDPTHRWSHWSAHTHTRFNRTCGTMMSRWGYPPVKGNAS